MGKFDRFFEDDKPEDRENKFDTARRKKSSRHISGLPSGSWIADGVFCMESLYSIGSHYGAGILGNPDEMEIMRHFGASGVTVFLDLETTGLAGGTGTYAFLCGVGAVSGNFFKISQFFLESPAYEAQWLDAVDSSIPKDASLVTYNGRAFDMPLLYTRHIMARKKPHWEETPHIDLLHFSRRLYKGYLESCSLGSIEKNILRLARGGQDIPGAMIPAIYTRYLHSSDTSELIGVFYHNELDIASLASLYCHVARVLGGNTADGRELLRAGDIWRRFGHGRRAAQLWNMACKVPNPHVDALVRRAIFAKRNGDFDAARADFLSALDKFRRGERHSADGVSELTILEELAKLEEHRFKSWTRAIEYVDEAINWLRSNIYIQGRERAAGLKSMEHRRKRLLKKILAARALGELNDDVD
ncbi:MAG: ribonuclease H-like domain-containing protein [Synergistaceae bacterium]|nr:ribonuclease H-like domain-containing protein [Synergistaceae bacterium]